MQIVSIIKKITDILDWFSDCKTISQFYYNLKPQNLNLQPFSHRLKGELIKIMKRINQIVDSEKY